MDANEEMIRTMHDDPKQAYDYFSNNYHNLTNSEKVDLTKELLYAIYDMCDEETHKRVLMTAAENLADHNDIDLYDNEMKQTEEVLTSESCLEGSTKENYTNRLLILRDTSLQEGYRKPEYQYFYATGGFGCNPDSLGTKVYGSFLYDNVDGQFYRSDFLGVADPAKLPAWASKKMEDKVDDSIIQEPDSGRK